MRIILLAAFGAAVWSVPGPVRAEDKTVEVEQEWKAGSSAAADNDLWKKAPKDGVIASTEAWGKLWKAWYGDKAAPKVDFEKELIIVVAGPGPNTITVGELKLTENGDLQFDAGITEVGGNGFVARVLKVKRAGIKTVNGATLPKG